MAQIAEMSRVAITPFVRVDRHGNDKTPAPVIKWLASLALGAGLATVCGFIWFLQEVASYQTSLGATVLFGAVNLGAVKALVTPPFVTTAVLCLLAFWGSRIVEAWRVGVLRQTHELRVSLEERVQDLETRLNRSNSTLEYWREQTRKAEEQTRQAETARLELEARIGRLADREKRLGKEQEELSRAKDRLEKHVEVRTIELHRLQRRYESILNCAGEGICSSDLEGRIRFVNPAAVSMMGGSREELLGQNESEVFADRAGKDVGEKGDEEPQGASHPAPVVFQRRDGSRFPVEMIRTPVEENGRQVGTVLIFKDVTERTEADERFAEKVAELARSNAELEQFAFVASHDLQEPLRKIQAFGDRLGSRLGPEISPEASDYLTRMRNAAARMQGLIDGLLMYSRVLTRGQPFAEVDLNTVVREVMEDLEVRIEKSGAELTVEQLPCIEADPLQMRQLLQNLIGNALKFQPPGNKPQVRVSARLVSGVRTPEDGSGNGDMTGRGEVCELTVADNGIGFDEAYLKRLFVVFQRLHSRSEFEGTGIGLAVCRKIAHRHGGSITASSKPGEGATFNILLPVKQEPGKGGAS